MTEDVSNIKRRPVADEIDKEFDNDSSLHGEKFYQQIDEMLGSNHLDVEQAYYMLKSRFSEDKNDLQLLLRLAESAHLLAGLRCKPFNRSGIFERIRVHYITEAYEYASLALKLNSKMTETNKWYAITLESLSKTYPFRQRVALLPEIREHLQSALSSAADDGDVQHYLGRWCLEVSSMTFLQKLTSRVLEGFKEPVTSQEARKHFICSYCLDGARKDNYLYIARTYVLEGDWENAYDWVTKGRDLPYKFLLDHEVDDELHELLDAIRPNIGNIAM